MIFSTEVPPSPHYLFILMITTMNSCKYPEIKFISFLIFSQYQMRINFFIKIKTFSYLPTQILFRRLPETHIIFFRPHHSLILPKSSFPCPYVSPIIKNKSVLLNKIIQLDFFIHMMPLSTCFIPNSLFL